METRDDTELGPSAALGRRERAKAEKRARILAAARALVEYESDAAVLCRKAMGIASELCVYTNDRLTVESMDSTS